MMAMFNKAKSTSPTKMPELIKSVSSTIETNIGIMNLISIGTFALGMDQNGLEELRLPLDGTTSHFTSGVQYLNWDKEPNYRSFTKIHI